MARLTVPGVVVECKRIRTSEVSEAVTNRTPFINHNKTMFARWLEYFPNLYVAYSYGTHFPLYVYDKQADKWFGNNSKYSTTSGRHLTQAMPATDAMNWMSQLDLQLLVKHGGWVNDVAARLEGR